MFKSNFLSQLGSPSSPKGAASRKSGLAMMMSGRGTNPMSSQSGVPRASSNAIEMMLGGSATRASYVSQEVPAIQINGNDVDENFGSPRGSISGGSSNGRASVMRGNGIEMMLGIAKESDNSESSGSSTGRTSVYQAPAARYGAVSVRRARRRTQK
jgi:hypothetical protein